MTTTALHPTPSLSAVAREQIRAVRAALRPETIVMASLLAFGLIMTAIGAYRVTQHPGWHMTIFFDAGAVIPLLVAAVFVPMGVWRAEDRARRAYHWSMPVSTTTHTLLKVLAGWVFMMVLAAAYVAYIYLLRDIAAVITNEWPSRATRGWELALAFSGPTIAYLVTTIFVVGSGHPWRWAIGAFGGWFALFAIAEGAQMPGIRDAVWRAWGGPYGLSSALAGAKHWDVSSWMAATAIWLAIALLLTVLAARRHPQG